ncbi:MAG: aminotransferase class III-fold pyridoxal phosphate-dependent enzyme [Chlamydiales bacterium]|nr:aminotransferase class III-fold pyridoxal phosphate-dependent enzyme [Chlamydiales bacterium]
MSSLAADNLFQDPRVKQAKQLLLDALDDAKKTLKSVRAPDPARVQSYSDVLDRLGDIRAGKTFYPYLGSGIGNGCLVELLDGSVKYDFITGIGVHYFGHNHPQIVEACIDAALSNTVMQGHLQQNKDSMDLGDDLKRLSGMDHCFLTSSGAMANENALKLAFQRHQPATRVLAFNHCFAGRTCTLSQITDKPQFRQGLPLNLAVDYVPFFDAANPEESTANSIRILKDYLARYPGAHAIMIFEFVQGEGGFYSAPPSFFRQLMEICKKHHVAVFADEVQTFGRLPQLFGYQYFGVSDLIDIATIGKLSLVCATLFSKDYRPKPGLLSQTYTSSTSAIRASRVVLKQLVEDNYLGETGKIATLGNYFRSKLEELSKRKPNLIKGPFGLGAMVAFTPFDGGADNVARFVHQLFQTGVISFVAGSDPTRVRFLVPMGAISKHDIDAVMQIIEVTLTEQA